MRSPDEPSDPTRGLTRDVELQLIEALRRREGRATLADIVRDTGLPREHVELHLRTLLGLYTSHLDVDESGVLLYRFETSFTRRVPAPGFEDSLRRIGRWCWKAFVVSFKITIMALLVTYVVVFCVLIIAAVVALLFFGDSGPDVDIGDVGEGAGCLGNLGEALMFWTPGDILYVPLEAFTPSAWQHQPGSTLPTALRDPRALEPAYTTDTIRTRRRKKKRFYDDVFDFVFGPSLPDPPAQPDDRELLAWIIDHRGVITLAELISRTGLSAEAADQEMTRLLVRYGGDVQVSPQGHLLYTFHELRVTGGASSTTPTPLPAAPSWHRFEPTAELTGNTTGRNVLIGVMAGFTLLTALAAPFLIFPILNIVGFVAVAGLSIIPALVSLLFFLIPAIRAFSLGAENARRRERNLRRALLLVVFDHIARADGAPLLEADLPYRVEALLTALDQRPPPPGVKHRRTMVGLTRPAPDELRRAWLQLRTELDAQVYVDDRGRACATFPALQEQLAVADTVRLREGDAIQPLGPIIFSSEGDDPEPPAAVSSGHPAEATAAAPRAAKR